MTIEFRIAYRTNFGENLVVVLGDGARSKSYPMQYILSLIHI